MRMGDGGFEQDGEDHDTDGDGDTAPSPAGEHFGHGTRFYGDRDFGWYGGHGRITRDLGASREFEREDYERPGTQGAMCHDRTGPGQGGCERPDNAVREEVCDGLAKDPEIDASHIEVRVQDGMVILEGTVDSLEAKHGAENLCEWIQGVQDVTNHLKVMAGPAGHQPPS
jgi:BON domain